MPPDLLELLEYFTPLAGTRYESGGAVTLHTPGTNVLALNATYLPGPPATYLPATYLPDTGQEANLAPLVATVATIHPAGVPVEATLRLDTLNREAPGSAPPAGLPNAPEPSTVVEQVSRLHLPAWCRVLAQAHGTPDWAGALAVHFARVLEPRRDYALLLAYRDGVAVGAGLWQPTGPTGSALHLWGVLDAAAQGPLLEAARTLGGGALRFSRVAGLGEEPREEHVDFRRI